MTNPLRRYRWSIFRVAGFVLFASCLLFAGLQGSVPAYYLYLAIMNVTAALYMMTVMAFGFFAQLFGWVPSEQGLVIIHGAIIVSLEILQCAFIEGAWQLIRSVRKNRVSKEDELSLIAGRAN